MARQVLSSGSSQKVFSFMILSGMFTLFVYLVHFFFAGTSEASTSYHDDIGVLRWVDPRIGTYGVTPNGNGGMIPSVSPPFGMTRWTPQTREVGRICACI
jgi:putative alpha-1,2-mannosidase